MAKTKKQREDERRKQEGKWLYSLNHYTAVNFKALFSPNKAGQEAQTDQEQMESAPDTEEYNQVKEWFLL